MAKIIFRQEAIDDLNNIWNYTYEMWSENQADKYYTMLKIACEAIGKKPPIGKKYTQISPNLFGLHSGRHIIFYQVVQEDEIEIVRILHEQMDLKRRLDL